MASTYCGTPITMAPEIHEGDRYSFSADIWSLGCILYELYIGYSPFWSNSREKMKQDILNCNYEPLPPHTLDEISDIVSGCLKRNPKERMTIEQILDSEYLQDFKDQNNQQNEF